jgi:hypothetical protein
MNNRRTYSHSLVPLLAVVDLDGGRADSPSFEPPIKKARNPANRQSMWRQAKLSKQDKKSVSTSETFSFFFFRIKKDKQVSSVVL